ncbi:lipopolysaccharide transport system ATP-binding protein [Escherichia coli]|nr:lipopolysaccharide transport system ATP-binding protein [Escherichia coli]GCY10764.1 lipopolysaccharide transport system ATP-binding protein [Escherichia coli]
MPIKTYSSGMRSRLGFGLSMAFNFDYYLVDEITAVGDARFKEKCAKLFKAKHSEFNFIMVSHSLHSLKEFCDVAIYLGRNNMVYYFDDVDYAIKQYLIDEKINPRSN